MIEEEALPDLVGIGAAEVVANAARLGLSWRLVTATVLSSSSIGVRVRIDGDSAEIDAVSMVGHVSAEHGQRVFVALVPPGGAYIIGWVGDPHFFRVRNGRIEVFTEEDSSGLSIDFNYGYGIYVDNVGVGGAANNRMWINTPNDGDVIIGPRTGADAIANLRLRTDLTTASAANVFMNSSTFVIARSTSSAKYKANISDVQVDLDKFRRLRPVRFQDKREFERDGERAIWHVGFVAEELDAIGLKDFVYYDEDTGEPDSVQYDRLAVGLLQLIQDLDRRLIKLEAAMAARQ